MGNNEKKLRTMLKSLIAEKKSGNLDVPEKFNNQDEKWRNVLSYETLWKCIKHRCPEVRRDVLELLVVSKKSTQRFIQVEFQLIGTFFEYSLGEKIDFVPLIKKAIRRTRDSLVVLQRELVKTERVQKYQDNHVCPVDVLQDVEQISHNITYKTQLQQLIQDYESFLVSLREICVKNLYPTANYERRRSSLQILCHMQDILDRETIDLEWNANQAQSLFNCLLVDTYETNKQMIFKILEPIPPDILKLDDKDVVAEIIHTAIGLGNSIRPIDSATAAYMFKICLASPVVVKNVVRQRYEFLSSNAADDFDVHLTLVILLILQLEKPLEIARENIVKAASMHSLYGYIYCIRILITDWFSQKFPTDLGWRKSIADLVDLCFDLNQAVGQIVNNSSPEGHLPMDLNPRNLGSSFLVEELVEFEKITTPQMVLLCAWRTVKEVSLLFGYLTANLPIDEMDGAPGLLTEKQVVDIGEHFVTLLSETKHRGAFEQAHVGFGQLCGRLWHQPDVGTLKQLPKIWLLELLLAVTGLSPRDSKLCATRRSAGIPFMVQALLTTEDSMTAVIKNGGSFTFHSTMRILLGLTTLKDDEDMEAKMISLIYSGTAFAQFQDLYHTHSGTKNPERDPEGRARCHSHSYRLAEVKTHVINILRALFRHCQLGECVKPYIADGVITAIKSYNGKTWAERNAATLLFSAMVVRIFGVQRTKDHLNLSVHNKMTGKVFFERYPSLLDFMYAQLEEFVKPGDTLIRPGVQSVLLLLSRLYPGCHDSVDSDWKVAEFIHMVSKCAKSQVYETRELAARALVPLLNETTAPVTFSKILERVSVEPQNYRNINMLHGYILQILQISKSPEFAETSQFATFQPTNTRLIDFVKNTLWILEKLENQKCGVGISFPLATSYLETLSEIYRVNGQWLNNCVQDEGVDVVQKIRGHLVQREILGISPGREIYEVAAAKFFTQWCIGDKTVNDDCPRTVVSSEGKNITHGWTQLLYHDNVDVQIVAWLKSAELVSLNSDSAFKKRQIKEAIVEAGRAVEECIDDPNLEEAIFEYLYVIFTSTSDNNPYKANRSVFTKVVDNVTTHLLKKLSNPDYYVRDSFLRLLGAIFGEISNQSQYKFSIGDRRTIYELFFKNSWMDSCNNDCRLAVSQTMYNLYQPAVGNNDFFVLYWWTILLNLLVDDDKAVRQNAAAIVCKVDAETEVVCDAGVRRIFFEKFSNTVAKDRPELAIVALFSWGVASWREDDHEMDDTDVFNKCRNYDSFEQMEISNLSLASMKEISEEYPIGTKLSFTSIQWLQQLYDCQLPFATLSEFAKIHEETSPILGTKLDDCLDPTYGDKLQQALAFKQFVSFIYGESNNGTNGV